jgi:predicted RNA-binding protein with PUA-like domain
MVYWLIKSEPDAYSWAQMQQDKRTYWSGVRNHQAAGNLRAMKIGDLAFFYHSNVGKEVVGIVEIVATAYPDPSDETKKFVMVDVAYKKSMPKPVTLAQMKSEKALSNLQLIKQSRLSVVPVRSEEWQKIIAMGGLK